MVHVQSFSSPEEMQQYLKKSAEMAHQNLHPSQRDMTYGSHWVRFYDMKNRIVDFGYAHTLDEIRNDEMGSGSSEDEVRATLAKVASDLEVGLMYGTAYSILEPSGTLGHTHKAHAWPIEVALFDEALAVEWKIDDFSEGARVRLQLAYTGIRNHMLSTP